MKTSKPKKKKPQTDRAKVSEILKQIESSKEKSTEKEWGPDKEAKE